MYEALNLPTLREASHTLALSRMELPYTQKWSLSELPSAAVPLKLLLNLTKVGMPGNR